MSGSAGQFVRLLGSNQDGEVIAACRALGRALEAAGRDFHWLADSVDRQLTIPVIPYRREPERLWQSRARVLLQAATSSLTKAEADFLRAMSEWRGIPSGAQLRWLDAIEVAFKRSAA